MKENMVFCAECRNDVYYTLAEKNMAGTLKGDAYDYVGKIAHCDNCKEEVYVAHINDYNLNALYDVYRTKNGIIPLDKILEIPKKYAIGKRSLSLLLGWGEQTFSRYYDGDMPTKQYSEILQRIYDDPNYYASILEKNKSNVPTAIAYKKSKRIVDTILGASTSMHAVDKTKIDVIIEYLLNQCEDITPLALQKALYYVQGFYYAFNKEFIFEENCEAWVHGPVYKNVYSRFSDYHFNPIDTSVDFDTSVFFVAEKATIDSVIKNLCCYSGKILEEFTHLELPWIQTRGDLPVNAACVRTIDKDLIGNYFFAIKEKYDMLTPTDIKGYAQKMFEKM